MRRRGPGRCELCGREQQWRQMARHLSECAPKHDAVGSATPLVQVQFEARGAPEYWLILEARGSAHLSQVDALLRRTWLECCGHMSAFRLGRQELSMRTSLMSLGGRGGAFQYEYDFGSTTALAGKIGSTRDGSLGRRVVRLLARNTPLPLTCSLCTAPATLICSYCIHAGACLFCSKHAGQHPCDTEDALLPVVNSPRVGVCGYTG